MSKCLQCNIEILDETERCPLCKSVLEQTAEMENMYPDVKMMTRKMVHIRNIYLFCAILLEGFLVYINVILDSKTLWSVIPGLGLLYLYMVISYAILGKSGYMSKILVLTMLALAMTIAVDFVIGYRGWSVDYAIPAAILLVNIGILILVIINRRNWQSYIMTQILMILCSLIPIILWLNDMITHPLLCQIAFVDSLAQFLGMVIIGDRRARLELKRRFHI
ncbi:MAG: DUF6320 domain-containing protein [Clostridiales bacterium]|nr:DUF6320 domain-containing protein [Clostridiales bacterium]